jgi:hypothetical protein
LSAVSFQRSRLKYASRSKRNSLSEGGLGHEDKREGGHDKHRTANKGNHEDKREGGHDKHRTANKGNHEDKREGGHDNNCRTIIKGNHEDKREGGHDNNCRTVIKGNHEDEFGWRVDTPAFQTHRPRGINHEPKGGRIDNWKNRDELPWPMGGEKDLN